MTETHWWCCALACAAPLVAENEAGDARQRHRDERHPGLFGVLLIPTPPGIQGEDTGERENAGEDGEGTESP